MVKVHVSELKSRLSHFLRLVQNGETIIIMKRNIEIGEMAPPKPATGKRELGLMRKEYPNFQWDFSRMDEPLSNEEISLWENGPIFPPKEK